MPTLRASKNTPTPIEAAAATASMISKINDLSLTL